jgi:hypothetical protein
MQNWITHLLLVILLGLTACSSAPPTSVDHTLHSSPKTEATDVDASPISESTIERLKSFLSQQSGIPTAETLLQQVEVVTWSDACLGAAEPEELCLQVVTPGYRAVFSTPNGEYTLHSNQTGSSYRLAQAPSRR